MFKFSVDSIFSSNLSDLNFLMCVCVYCCLACSTDQCIVPGFLVIAATMNSIPTCMPLTRTSHLQLRSWSKFQFP